MVVSDLRDKIRQTGDEWSEAVILYRTNSQSAVLEDNLRRRGVPYRIYKGSSFYDHKEVKDMLAYIRLVINPRDDEAFKRIVNYPARGIGDTTVQRIAELAAGRGVSMWEAVDTLVAEPAADPVQKTIARKVSDFVAMIRGLSLARNEKSLYDFGLEIATRSGIIAAYRYRFALYNLYENPDMDIMEALNLSKRQTQGYKMELFKLDLSYMGWILLSILPSLFFTSQAILTLGFSGMDPYAALAAPMPLWQILTASAFVYALSIFYLPNYQCVQLAYFDAAKEDMPEFRSRQSDFSDGPGSF